MKYLPRNEFRYNKITNHMNYVFGSNGKKNKSLGLTTESETFGKKNMPLDDPIKMGTNKKSYIRNGYITQSVNTYSHTSPNCKFSKNDFPKVKSKVRNYKRKNKGLW